jgi:flagellar hook-basal body complex protein FliE
MQAGQVSGDIVSMTTTHPSHFGHTKIQRKGAQAAGDDLVSGFAGALKDAFYKVNDLQLQSDELTKALAVRPETVDVHDVTIAAEKARIALLFAKSIVDRVTQAYKELINVR